MSESTETTPLTEPVAPTTLLTEATTPPGTEPDPAVLTPPEPKQPGQAEDDSPIVEPAPLQPTDITLPDDVEVSEELRDEFLSVLNDKELDAKGRAQALIDLQLKAATSAAEAQSAAWAEMQTKWQDEVKSDADLGGDKLQPALGRIGRLLSEYGSEELSGVLDMTGAGNSLHVIKFLDRIAAKLTEGGAVIGQPLSQERSAAQKLFPSMKG